MAEMLKNAWTGWHDVLEDGKLIGLLLIVMAVFVLLSLIGLKRKTGREMLLDIGQLLCPEQAKKGAVLAAYTMVMLIICICPVTAVFLMYYQTKFYDYYWVFSYVPVTIVLALSVAAVICMLWKGNTTKKKVMKAGTGTVLILFVIFLCGAGRGQGQDSTPVNDYKKTASFLENIQQRLGDERICLWASEEIMDSVRRVSPEVRLLYGRNVWDRALDAYSFDGTEQWMEDMYEWMEEINEGTAWKEEYTKYLDDAMGRNVNVIVLSRDTLQELRDRVAEYTGSAPVEISDAYVYLINR